MFDQVFDDDHAMMNLKRVSNKGVELLKTF
jgi:hypothetical protein